MEEFDYKKFLVENKLTPNSRLLRENMEGVEINGNTPIPVEAWKSYYTEYVDEIEGSMYAIEPEDQSFAKDTVEHMKTGIQNPPSTLDAAIEFLRKQYQLAGNGFGMMGEEDPTQAILDIVIIHNKNPSTQFDADQLDDIERYVDAKYYSPSNLNESVLAGAASVALGILGVVGLVKGLSVAKRLAGETLDFAAGKALNKLNANIDARRKEELLSKIEPIADKFSNDEQLKAMYDSLPARIDSVSKQAVANNEKRNKQLRDIAKYIKSKLTEDEMEHFEDVSKFLRTGTV